MVEAEVWTGVRRGECSSEQGVHGCRYQEFLERFSTAGRRFKRKLPDNPMNRRSWFRSLLAPVVARFARKRVDAGAYVSMEVLTNGVEYFSVRAVDSSAPLTREMAEKALEKMYALRENREPLYFVHPYNREQ